MSIEVTAKYALVKYYRLYWFGMILGIKNLFKNGGSLGLKKTLGKIFQPINSYSRYPEYECFFQFMEDELSKNKPMKILDIGSPKLIGMYLAYYYPVDLLMTDIYECNIEEYVQLWGCLKGKAKGEISFEIVDGRNMQFKNETFDMVYSMSVIEHIDTEDGDILTVAEMNRVLKNNGNQIVSIPYGDRYVEQYRNDFSYDSSSSNNEEKIFFQKIYTLDNLKESLPANSFAKNNIVRIERVRCHYLNKYLTLPENIRGMLGWLSPLLAILFSKIRNGFGQNESCDQYANISKANDIYPDVVMRIPKYDA